MSSRTHLLSLALLLGCAGTSETTEPGPEPGDQAPSLQTVVLALNWYPEPEFGGFYEAKLSGIYEEAGFDVQIVPGGPGAPSLELLASGKADVAISAADDLLVKRTKGIAAVGVWPAFQHTPQGLMVHQGTGVTTLADVLGQAGKTLPEKPRVAIEIGSPFQSFLWKQQAWEGKVEPVPYGGSVGPFVADATLITQAYITSEPCLAQAKGAKTTFLKASEAGWDPYGTLVAVADPPPAWARAFVEATVRGWKAYLAEPTRSNQRMVELNDQLSMELMGCITQAQRPFVEGDDGLGTMTAARWDAVNAALLELGLVPEGPHRRGRLGAAGPLTGPISPPAWCLLRRHRPPLAARAAAR